jgi:hypothetical protein
MNDHGDNVTFSPNFQVMAQSSARFLSSRKKSDSVQSLQGSLKPQKLHLGKTQVQFTKIKASK